MKIEDLIAKGLNQEQAEAILEIYNEEINNFVSKADYDALKEKIGTLEQDSRAADEKHRAEIESLKINSAIDMALTNAGAKTLKACKAMLDMDGIKLSKDGCITGLNEQLKALREGEDTKYLFNTDVFKGAHIGSSNEDDPVNVDDMNYTQLCAYMEANPGKDLI